MTLYRDPEFAYLWDWSCRHPHCDAGGMWSLRPLARWRRYRHERTYHRTFIPQGV